MVTPTEIEAFRLRYRLSIVERLALKALLLLPLLNRQSLSESQSELKDWLDKCSESADEAYGEVFRDPSQMALYADEVKIIVEEMKGYVDSLVGDLAELRKNTT